MPSREHCAAGLPDEDSARGTLTAFVAAATEVPPDATFDALCAPFDLDHPTRIPLALAAIIAVHGRFVAGSDGDMKLSYSQTSNPGSEINFTGESHRVHGDDAGSRLKLSLRQNAGKKQSISGLYIADGTLASAHVDVDTRPVPKLYRLEPHPFDDTLRPDGITGEMMTLPAAMATAAQRVVQSLLDVV